MNIYSYIENSHEEIKRINELDALILSRLAYIHLEDLENKLPFTIEELNDYMENIKINKNDEKLVKLLAKSIRFKKLVIERCKSIFDKNKEEQFFAVTILLPKERLFIAYRGTNKSLIGIKEDLNMSYMTIPSQIDALLYLDGEKNIKSLYLGGHSKGGNLAMYALIHSSFFQKLRIRKVFNFDGPGFLQLGKDYQMVKNKIINYYPENSIIGRLLENDSKRMIIKTDKRGLESHNIYSWQIEKNHFKLGTLNNDSDMFSLASKELLDEIVEERRGIIINCFFDIIEKNNIEKLKNLDFKEIINAINNAKKITKEEKQSLNKFLKAFLILCFPEMSSIKKNH